MIASALFFGCATTGMNINEAASGNDVAAVQAFLTAGRDVNTLGIFGTTPLYMAAQGGNVQMVKLLLDHGAKIDAMAMGVTPLTIAIWRGYTEVVRVLVSRGANVNIVSSWKHKFTPIIYCGAYGNAEITKMLIDAGADINARDAKGKSAADWATEYKKFEVLALLRKAGAPASYTGDAKNDIVMAVLSDDREKVRTLIEGGIDPNTKTKSGKSLLEYAVENKWSDVVELLIKHGANTTSKDRDGWTVLMKATLGNQDEMILAFKRAGVELMYTGNTKDDLLTAVLKGDYEKVKALLAKGMDVDSTYRYKSPLLNYAIVKNDKKITNLLIENKANINLGNEYGVTPFLAALSTGNVELAREMIKNGANVNATEKDGFTALMRAIVIGDVAMVKNMLDKGAQADILAVTLSQGQNPYFKQVNYPEITAMIKPELLRRQMLRAQAAVEVAQSVEDYSKAVKEYELARMIAPETAEIYYNLGLIQEKAGLFNDAIISLRKYIELAPVSSDAQAVKDMIYKIEYKRDQGVK
jgi:ankyrin repeat protein